MDVIDLRAEHRPLFDCCLEDWSPDAREGAPRRARWVERFLARGLRGHLARDDHGAIGAMVQHLPVEESWVEGAGLRFIPCIWVHGHKQGRGDFRGRGMGSALLEAAEADARRLGATGMAAWGLWLPVWMKARWFRRHGYRKADRQGLAVLVWKPFTPDARPPRWRTPGKPPAPEPGQVTVTAFSSGWCLGQNVTTERARRVAAELGELGERVVYHEIDTSEPAEAARRGFVDALFIDGKQVWSGPPPSADKLRRLMQQRLRRL